MDKLCLFIGMHANEFHGGRGTAEFYCALLMNNESQLSIVST